MCVRYMDHSEICQVTKRVSFQHHCRDKVKKVDTNPDRARALKQLVSHQGNEGHKVVLNHALLCTFDSVTKKTKRLAAKLSGRSHLHESAHCGNRKQSGILSVPLLLSLSLSLIVCLSEPMMSSSPLWLSLAVSFIASMISFSTLSPPCRCLCLSHAGNLPAPLSSPEPEHVLPLSSLTCLVM